VSCCFSGSPKHQMVIAIVGPSISCGIFLMLAINYFQAGNAFSVVLTIFDALDDRLYHKLKAA